jgi:hypothetical protein
MRKQDHETRQSEQSVPNLDTALSSHVKLRSLADNYQNFEAICCFNLQVRTQHGVTAKKTVTFTVSSARIQNLSPLYGGWSEVLQPPRPTGRGFPTL